MRYFFLIGAGFSDKRSLSLLETGIDSFVRHTKTDHETISCGFLGEEEEIVHRLINTYEERPLRIVVCGTLENLHFTVNGTVGVPGVEIAFLPGDPDCRFGDKSTNLFCVGISALESLFPGHVVDVDLVQINERYCVSGAVFGFDAGIRSIRRCFHQWRKRFTDFRLPEAATGRLFRLILMLFHASSKPVRICINGHEMIDDQMIYLLFANMRHCAEGYPTINQAIGDDGLVDMLSLEMPPLTLVPSYVLNDPCEDMLKNEQLREFVRHRRCITARVELTEPAVIAMDETLYLRGRRFVIETRPAALKMLVPGPKRRSGDQENDSAPQAHC